MQYKIDSFGQSDIGLVRENNEDVWGQIQEKNFYALADGMGGHLAGEVAAREAIDGVCRYIQESVTADMDQDAIKQLIADSIRQVNFHIFGIASRSEDLRGMGTTFCCLFFYEDWVFFGNVGDSRIYRLRSGILQQVTHDHSLLSEMVESGQMTAGESEDFQYKNIITKAIGTDPFVEPEVLADFYKEGDVYLLCSDGLTDMLQDDVIRAILSKSKSLKEGAKTLIASAKEKGGYDNITVVLTHIQKS